MRKSAHKWSVAGRRDRCFVAVRQVLGTEGPAIAVGFSGERRAGVISDAPGSLAHRLCCRDNRLTDEISWNKRLNFAAIGIIAAVMTRLVK